MNILIFTTLYPVLGPDKIGRQTRIIHNHAKEWVKQGHNVHVIHNDSLNLTPSKRYWESYGWTEKGEHNCEYDIDGVHVLLNPIHMNPIFRYIPCISQFSIIGVQLPRRNIEHYLKKHNFNPDVVLVHFCTTQRPILDKFLRSYSWKPVYVFHNTDLTLVSSYLIRKMVSEAKSVGVLSEKIHERLNQKCGYDVDTFQVLTGYPDSLMNPESNIRMRDRSKPIRILYAGRLIPLKNVDITLKALSILKVEYNFIFEIVGDGILRNDLESLVSSLGLEKNVVFHGNQPREFVLELMRQADCFLMVSSPETLGMVYIEALGCGCFVIGSRGEGIDGVIIHDVNGLLVQPKDIDALVSTLKYYFNLEYEKERNILHCARETSLILTESNVARDCLEHLIS